MNLSRYEVQDIDKVFETFLEFIKNEGYDVNEEELRKTYEEAEEDKKVKRWKTIREWLFVIGILIPITGPFGLMALIFWYSFKYDHDNALKEAKINKIKEIWKLFDPRDEVIEKKLKEALEIIREDRENKNKKKFGYKELFWAAVLGGAIAGTLGN